MIFLIASTQMTFSCICQAYSYILQAQHGLADSLLRLNKKQEPSFGP